MTRGRSGLLLLLRMALSSTTPCQFLPAHCRLLKKIQRRGARSIDERRRTLQVRCSEKIKRNEVYGSFSAACLDDITTLPKVLIKQRITALSPEKIHQIDEAIRFALD